MDSFKAFRIKSNDELLVRNCVHQDDSCLDVGNVIERVAGATVVVAGRASNG